MSYFMVEFKSRVEFFKHLGSDITHNDESNSKLYRRKRFDDGIEQGIAKGLKGLKQGSENIAVKLIHMGLSLIDIQKATELPLQRIHELAKNSYTP